MTDLRYHGVKFEAKKHAYRQTQDGISVTFIMHPDDVDAEFAVAPLGTMYHVTAVQLDDDGKPKATPQKAVYAEKSDGEKAVTRAALLCQDKAFMKWAEERFGVGSDEETNAAEFIRTACGVSSRAELATNQAALAKFTALEAEFLSACGRMTEVR